jgi:hypothetical protein
MRTFRRKLVVTPMLIAMALLALGLPASAQEAYARNGNEACCTAKHCCAEQGEDAGAQAADEACCPAGQNVVNQAECRPLSTDCCDQPQRGEKCDASRKHESCIPLHDCCPGSRGALECCL